MEFEDETRKTEITPVYYKMKNSNLREVEVVVISDVHLGTFGCRAKELIQYLKSIRPKTLVLNGDIIDIWQFNKRFFPKSHLKVLKQILDFVAKGTKVYYVTGNHDEMLRRFEGFELGSLKIVNKVVLELDGKKAWVFHGDVFDVTMKYSIWLAKLGGWGYDLLILLNTIVNLVSQGLGKERISLSKRVKENVKKAISYVNQFEETASEIATKNQFDYVVCGHIHQPCKRDYSFNNKSVLYLNSGDWVENLSALEYNKGEWRVYYYEEDLSIVNPNNSEKDISDLKTKAIFLNMIKDFETEYKTAHFKK